jgi:FAD/FMN-containing dehydrogenase
MVDVVNPQLGKGFLGELLRPGDPGYDSSIGLFNAMHQPRPALVARCAVRQDVVEVVNYAREQGLDLAVRGGGTHMAGHAGTNGGVLLDLSLMRRVTVDVARRRATVQGGALAMDLHAATESHGLAGITGAIGHIGLAGLTFGGGMGYLSPRWGFACDSVRSVELVTASGEVMNARQEENSELFWALKGAGHNFGVITEFEVDLYPFAGPATAGTLLYGPGQIAEALRVIREFEAHVSPDYFGYGTLYVSPDDPSVPVELRGQLTLGVTFVHLGEPSVAADELSWLTTAHEPFAVHSKTYGLAELHTMVDESFPASRQYWDEEQLVALDDTSLEFLHEEGRHLASSGPGGQNYIVFYSYRGAMSRPPSVESAYAVRSGCELSVVAFWDDPGQDDVRRTWARSVTTRARERRLVTGQVYLNAVNEYDEARLRRTFGDSTYHRLRAIKRRVDPQNLFRCNVNIPPADSADDDPIRKER